MRRTLLGLLTLLVILGAAPAQRCHSVLLPDGRMVTCCPTSSTVTTCF